MDLGQGYLLGKPSLTPDAPRRLAFRAPVPRKAVGTAGARRRTVVAATE